MSEFDDPQTINSSERSKARKVLATSLARRPYSSAVLWPTCHGPSISLPRHQCLTANGSARPCFLRRSPQALPVGPLTYSTKLRASSSPREPRLIASIISAPTALHHSANSCTPTAFDSDVCQARSSRVGRFSRGPMPSSQLYAETKLPPG